MPARHRSRWRAFADAGRGLRDLFATQFHARIHLLATAAILSLGWVLPLSRGEWLALVLAIALVLIAETFNTAIEQLGDAISRQHYPQIGRAKDLAAGAVLLAAGTAAVIGLIIFLPHLWAQAGHP